MPSFAVVIPALDEAGNIGRLVREIADVLATNPPVEIIVVDDCSGDATPDELRALIPELPMLRVLRHGTRAGQSAAIRTGVQAARADIIVTLDGDGQNPPGDIPGVLARLGQRPGSQPGLVNGWRKGRKATGSRRLASRVGNAVRAAILRDDCPDSGCGLKAYRRADYLRLPFFATMHRFMPALFRLHGHEIAIVEIGDRPRAAGASKYTNWKRAIDGACDLAGFVWLRWRSRNPAVSELSAPGGESS